METQTRRDPQVRDFVPPRVQRGLLLLAEAHDYAEDAKRDLWDFAVEMAELRNEGLTKSDLRWLVCRKYVEHACEITLAGAQGRKFQGRGDLTFGTRTAFVLTESGLRVARDVPEETVRSGNGQEEASTPAKRPVGGPSAALPSAKVPTWDCDRHELRLGDELVKVFKLPSPNQEMILTAFEEENWPPRIDDPLPQHPDLLPKRRLHDAIKGLNRNQKAKLIRFMGDGTGEGVRWELTAAENELVRSLSGAR